MRKSVEQHGRAFPLAFGGLAKWPITGEQETIDDERTSIHLGRTDSAGGLSDSFSTDDFLLLDRRFFFLILCG